MFSDLKGALLYLFDSGENKVRKRGEKNMQ